jgi:hypothetical protein
MVNVIKHNGVTDLLIAIVGSTNLDRQDYEPPQSLAAETWRPDLAVESENSESCSLFDICRWGHVREALRLISSCSEGSLPG